MCLRYMRVFPEEAWARPGPRSECCVLNVGSVPWSTHSSAQISPGSGVLLISCQLYSGHSAGRVSSEQREMPSLHKFEPDRRTNEERTSAFLELLSELKMWGETILGIDELVRVFIVRAWSQLRPSGAPHPHDQVLSVSLSLTSPHLVSVACEAQHNA